MFDGKYLEWNQKRIKGIIDFYGHPFMHQKKVLDLGCGYGDIGGALHRLGADITAVDARQDHLKIVSKKYPGIKTIKADLDRSWPFIGKVFDLVLDLGLLCHIDNYEAHLRSVCASATHLILETAVCDSDDPYKCVKITENKAIYDLSANGIGSYPSVAAIERVLKECGFSFKRRDDSKFNAGDYSYNWQAQNNGEAKISKRRIWFAVKSIHQLDLLNVPDAKSNLLPSPPYAPPSPVLQNSQMPLIAVPNIKMMDAAPAKPVKTALCISGHLRTFEENYKTVHDHILSKLDCDVFIHTWDILGLSYRHTDSHLHTIETSALVDKINQLYKPKKLVIEKSRQFDVKPIMLQRALDHRDWSGILSMYYKIEACNNIKREYEEENNFKYDCVIRFRGDLWVEQDIPIDGFMNLNYLYLPLYGNFGGACDQFAFGNSSVMDKYSSLYSNIESYLYAGAPFHPEKILQYHIEVQKLQVAKVNFKFVIRRANGLVQDNMLLERAWGFVR